MDMFWGGGILVTLFTVIVWIAIIWAIIALIRMLGGGRHRRYYSSRYGSSALSILDERYARGEINKEEYEIRKRDLMA